MYMLVEIPPKMKYQDSWDFWRGKAVLWYIRNGEAWNTIIETDHSGVEEYSRKNDKVIKACIEQQLKEDELSEQ